MFRDRVACTREPGGGGHVSTSTLRYVVAVIITVIVGRGHVLVSVDVIVSTVEHGGLNTKG